MNNKPLVFISYAGEEIDLADFVKKILLRVSKNKIEVFVAKRDISSGADPLKTMLNEKLKKADAIIPICSIKSKETPWLWWESASVWATTGKVHPLFTNISPNAFGPPLSLVVQGKDYFIEEDFFDTIKTLCENIEISTTQLNFIQEEKEKYAELKKSYSEHIPLSHVNIDYKVLEKTQDYHKYSLLFEIQNKSHSAFEDIVLDLFFPTIYLIPIGQNYDHLKSSFPKDKPKYTCLTFIFNNMPKRALQQFNRFLLPGKTLKIFGVDNESIKRLDYEMDINRFMNKQSYEVSYDLYINRGAPQKGSIDFSNMEVF